MSPKTVRSFVTDRPVAVLMLFIAAVVFGGFSYGRLALTLMPELSYPTLTVRTEYPGAAPEEVENDISRPVEAALGVIGGLRKISSVSRSEVSDVVLEFSWDTNINDATQSVLERLDLVFLPDEAKRPLILHFDPSLDPVMELSLSGQGKRFEGEEGLRRLRRLADLYVKRQLEPIKGVAAVRVKGGLEEEINVLLDEGELRRTGIPIQQVIDRLAQENINVAGGTIQEGRTEYLVRTLNEYENLDQIEDTIVASIGGRDVRVKDLGKVEFSHKERQIVTHTDGSESVQIEIYKEADANIVSLAKNVKFLVGKADPEPDSGRGLAQQIYKDEGAQLKVVADRSVFIESSIKELRNTALLGGLLAIFVLYLFLREFRSTAIIAVSIPISLLVTFAPMHLFGVSLNIMSLGGLALGIGMLVDSSIVVLESIHRCRQEGDDFVPAAVRGTQEVRSAVWASTLTSIAVFFPMVFVQGVAGQAFGDLGLAVVASLLASAAVALYLIPMLASRSGIKVEELSTSELRLAHFGSFGRFKSAFGDRSPRARIVLIATLLPALYFVLRLVVGVLLELVGKLILALFMLVVGAMRRILWPIGARVLQVVLFLFLKATNAALGWLQRVYPRALRWILANPGITIVFVLAALGTTVLVGASLDSELLPQVHQGEFTVEVTLPVGTPLKETMARLEPVENAILTNKKGIESLLVTYGYDPAQSEDSDEGEHTAKFKVLLARGSRGAKAEERIIKSLRTRLADLPDVSAQITRPVLFSSKTPVEVEIYGDDLVELRRMSERVRKLMGAMPALADVEATLQSGAPEIQVVYDRDRLSRFGLNIRKIAQMVRDKVQGNEATRFNLLDRRVPILVRLDEEERETVGDVEGLVVNPEGERPITLGSVAKVEVGEGPSEVRRVDGRRVALIRANLSQGSLSEAVESIKSELHRQVDWPTGMGFFISGQNEEWEHSKGSLYLALALSIFLVYVIMAIQFESLLHPL
ncbi:MAG TPA: efflux RND transporter permease subunit, partial [Candidatus Krumholzibacteria bacterium]|nr:efflux RND transporter permease subunit [Candidatus Krumholzibacteria bacterium]